MSTRSERGISISIALMALYTVSASAQPAARKVPLPTNATSAAVPAVKTGATGFRLKPITAGAKPASL